MKPSCLLLAAMSVIAAGCSSLMLTQADFSWPIEDVAKVDANGMVREDRYSLSFNVKPLLYAETRDSVNVAGQTIRIIRNEQGYYFITAKDFKNVYVFRQDDGRFKIEKTIPVSKEGLSSPAFNQREPYIELVNGDNQPIMLTKDGILKEGKK